MARTQHHTYIPIWERGYGGKQTQCPFGVRDLAGEDVCYSGNGQNKCRYFVRYEWCNAHNGCVNCTHPPIDVKQLTLF